MTDYCKEFDSRLADFLQRSEELRLVHAPQQCEHYKIFLFYSNSRPEDAAFLDELTEARTANPNYTFIGTMTQMEKSNRAWHGETGYITQAMLLKYIGDLALPIYYVSGPQSMVQAMREILNEAGVNDDNIRTEEFTDY